MKGHEIKTLRNQLGLSQRQLAKRLGVSTRSIRRWEKGQSMPQREAAEKLTTWLNDVQGDTPQKADTSKADTSQKADTLGDVSSGNTDNSFLAQALE